VKDAPKHRLTGTKITPTSFVDPSFDRGRDQAFPESTNSRQTSTQEGGSALPATAFANSEEYELEDYIKVRAIANSTSQEVQRQEKRAAKLRALDEVDNMKFSHSIQFNAVPDWSSHYIAYSNLKKL